MAISPDTTRYYTGPSVGLGNAPSYQSSGGPFVTGSVLAAGEEIRINFPTVTKEIVMLSTEQNNACVLSFQPTGSDRVQAGFHTLPFPIAGAAGGTVAPIVLNIKTDHVYVSSVAGAATGWNIYAALTGINVANMYPLTGSGITD